ncbi:hypothetical protein BKA66DRAFT_150108 [Pyrenochaeta sp. MPI-SDFR-AT-0127]|nr:hypothetical protein BKA66DRAFT_150108 [Pyrenochaeta sp. MPI-SDFR-AT-0127]
MRSPNHNTQHVESTTIISQNANLSITITMQSKQKRQTKKYRAVARPDGVIIEYPKYQPATSPPRQTFQFEKKVFTLDEYSKMLQAKKLDKTIERRTEDLLNIGAFLKEHSDAGGNGLLQHGRGGYNGVFDLEAELHEELQVLRNHQKCAQSPMPLFLAEVGPWSNYELRQR